MAAPHAYADFWQVYFEETSAHHRGVLGTAHFSGGTYVFDRFNNRRPSLVHVESVRVTVFETGTTMLDVDMVFEGGPKGVVRKSSDAARRAGRRGAAVRWGRTEQRKAA